MHRSFPRYPNEISRYRKQLGLTQSELAEALGVAKETVTAWECGYVLPRLPRLFEASRDSRHGRRESLLASLPTGLAGGRTDSPSVPPRPWRRQSRAPRTRDL